MGGRVERCVQVFNMTAFHCIDQANRIKNFRLLICANVYAAFFVRHSVLVYRIQCLEPVLRWSKNSYLYTSAYA